MRFALGQVDAEKQGALHLVSGGQHRAFTLDSLRRQNDKGTPVG